MINYTNNKESLNLGRKGFISSYKLQSIIEESEDIDLEARIEAKFIKECCLWVCSPWLTQSAFLYNPGHSAQGQHGPSVV